MSKNAFRTLKRTCHSQKRNFFLWIKITKKLSLCLKKKNKTKFIQNLSRIRTRRCIWQKTIEAIYRHNNFQFSRYISDPC